MSGNHRKSFTPELVQSFAAKAIRLVYKIGGQTGPNCFPRKDNTTKHAKKRPLSSDSKISVRNECETTSAPSN